MRVVKVREDGPTVGRGAIAQTQERVVLAQGFGDVPGAVGLFQFQGIQATRTRGERVQRLMALRRIVRMK